MTEWRCKQRWFLSYDVFHCRYKERDNIEALFFSIQAKRKANGWKIGIMSDGKLVFDIESGWKRLEKAEHDRELALREELMRSLSLLLLCLWTHSFIDSFLEFIWCPL